MIELLSYMFFVYMLMILAHESGHYLALLGYKIKPKEIKWKIIGLEYPSRLDNKQKNGVRLAGVVAGFLPAFMLYNFSGYAIFFILSFYIYGCMKDIKKIYLEMKNDEI